MSNHFKYYIESKSVYDLMKFEEKHWLIHILTFISIPFLKSRCENISEENRKREIIWPYAYTDTFMYKIHRYTLIRVSLCSLHGTTIKHKCNCKALISCSFVRIRWPYDLNLYWWIYDLVVLIQHSYNTRLLPVWCLSCAHLYTRLPNRNLQLSQFIWSIEFARSGHCNDLSYKGFSFILFFVFLFRSTEIRKITNLSCSVVIM